jgi:hypothetical protein
MKQINQFHRDYVYHTNFTTIPFLGTICERRRSEPPYMSSPATISCPAAMKFALFVGTDETQCQSGEMSWDVQGK